MKDSDRPEPFSGNGTPTFTVLELLPYFCVTFGLFLLFLWSI